MATHLEILQHSAGMDQYGRRHPGTERNFFGTHSDSRDGKVCEELVMLGLMQRGRIIAWADNETVYHVTDAGFAYIRENSPAPPIPQKMTRSQKRWAEFRQVADCFDDFRHYLEYIKTGGRVL